MEPALILVCFTLTLLVKLPELVSFGTRSIGAKWLLWLVAAVVLFVNAAFRDGCAAEPYPKWLGTAIRLAMPLLTVIASAALAALALRVHEYGLTVARVWGLIAAAFALVYALGYSRAAFTAGPWMAGIANQNVFAAAILIAVLSAALTPALSPERLASNSQFSRALHWRGSSSAAAALLGR